MNEDPEEIDELENEYLVDKITQIQEEYRRKWLKEALIGPVVSSVFHILLIILLAIVITDTYKEEVTDIKVELQEIEEVQIEEPEPLEEPEEAIISVLTTVAIENVESDDAALEDVNRSWLRNRSYFRYRCIAIIFCLAECAWSSLICLPVRYFFQLKPSSLVTNPLTSALTNLPALKSKVIEESLSPLSIPMILFSERAI